MSYVFTPDAQAEFIDATAFCKQHFGVLAAENFVSTFESKAALLADFPDIGTKATKGRRLSPIGKYPFSILYRKEDGIIRITAIAHHGRRPKYWATRP